MHFIPLQRSVSLTDSDSLGETEYKWLILPEIETDLANYKLLIIYIYAKRKRQEEDK